MNKRHIWLVVIITGLLIPIPAFATHQTEKIAWQVVVVSNSPACSNYHYELTQKYEIIKEYQTYMKENEQIKYI